MASAPKVCVIGLGNMGAGMARRLREQGVPLCVANRTVAKAKELSAEAGAPCTAHDTPRDAVAATAEDSLIVIVVSDTAGVLETIESVAPALGSRTVLNLTSGNPDEGREVERALRRLADKAHYIDGAYCGPPAKARAGAGQLFLSGESKSLVDHWEETLSHLGTVAFCGAVGTSRAIDYGVVDLAFINYLSFVANRAMLEKEGVDMEQYFAEAAKRLATVPAMMRMYDGRMLKRDDASYTTSTTATLSTWRSFWASRLPYLKEHGMPSQLPDFVVGLLDAAGGGPGGAHQGADASRLQETVRYNSLSK